MLVLTGVAKIEPFLHVYIYSCVFIVLKSKKKGHEREEGDLYRYRETEHEAEHK